LKYNNSKFKGLKEWGRADFEHWPVLGPDVKGLHSPRPFDFLHFVHAGDFLSEFFTQFSIFTIEKLQKLLKIEINQQFFKLKL